MSSAELLQNVQMLFSAFEDAFFLLSTLMITVSVCYGIKKLVLD